MKNNKFIKLHKFGLKLFPICRSITGKGLLESLKLLKNFTGNLEIKKVKSGTKVYDWTIPDEWEIKQAFVYDIKLRKKIIDFKENNLHIMNYSEPVEKLLNFKELLERIYVSDILPDAIPYVTSYYKRNWGFCISKNYKNKLIKKYSRIKFEKRFKINIESKFKKMVFCIMVKK